MWIHLACVQPLDPSFLWLRKGSFVWSDVGGRLFFLKKSWDLFKMYQICEFVKILYLDFFFENLGFILDFLKILDLFYEKW